VGNWLVVGFIYFLPLLAVILWLAFVAPRLMDSKDQSPTPAKVSQPVEDPEGDYGKTVAQIKYAKVRAGEDWVEAIRALMKEHGELRVLMRETAEETVGDVKGPDETVGRKLQEYTIGNGTRVGR
jgi:hypothetical protein